MSFSVGSPSADPDVMIDVNTTPLIDVMLVLLVMLIITIPIQTHAVKLEMPQAPPTEPEKKAPVVQIDVDFDHTILWNGTPISRAQLEAYFYEEGQKVLAEQAEIHIRPNQNAIYGDVAMVMANAQRHQVLKLAIIGYEQFPQYF